jgi:hypothetical protein
MEQQRRRRDCQRSKSRKNGRRGNRGGVGDICESYFFPPCESDSAGGSESGSGTIPYILPLHWQANLALAFCHTVTGLVLVALTVSGRWRMSGYADIGSKGSGLRARAWKEFKIGIRLSQGRLSISNSSCSVPKNLPLQLRCKTLLKIHD